jgi:hypothetical protein
MKPIRNPLFITAFTAFMGFAALVNAVSSPRFALWRGFEVARLLGSGMCFGVAIFSLAMFVRARR